MDEKKLDETINQNAFEKGNLKMSQNALDYAEFEQGMIQQTFANNMDSAQFALDTNRYLLELSAEEARKITHQHLVNFLRLSLQWQVQILCSIEFYTMLQIKNISTADAMQFLTFLQRKRCRDYSAKRADIAARTRDLYWQQKM